MRLRAHLGILLAATTGVALGACSPSETIDADAVRDDPSVTTDADEPTETTDDRIVLGGPDDEDPSDAGDPDEPSDVVDTSFLDLRPGDCIGEVERSGQTATLPVVDCSVPHRLEVYFSGELRFAAGAFPGQTESERRSRVRCLDEFDGYVGIPYADSELDFVYYSPTRQTWAAGDTSVQCLLEAPAPVSRSLRGTER